MSQTTYQLQKYYQDTLIIQYLGKPRAYATIGTQVAPIIMPQTSVQTVTFALAPTSGTFVLEYGVYSTAAINWNDSTATVQGKLQAVPGLGSVTVTGTIAGLLLTVTFAGVYAPALPLVLGAHSLLATATPVVPEILETDLTLPLAVQAGFNVIAPSPAVGKQLDVIGKYVGVTRTAAGFTTQITLDDADFLSLIQMAITTNNSGSSLAQIQQLLHFYFPGEVLVFDYADMHMSYLIASTVGSQQLVQLFITENLLPKPMGVQIPLIIYAPDITHFFGFRSYFAAAVNSTPFNDYASYHTDWPWLSYANAIIP